MTNFLKIIYSLVIFSIVAVNIQAQTIGSVTTASTSCSITASSCDGDTLTLTPQDQTSYTNYKWYRTTVSLGNEITAVNAAANNVVATGFAGSFPSIQVISGGGTYILTAEYATPGGCATKNDTFELNFTPLPTANTASLTLCATNSGGTTADFTLSSADAVITGGASGVTVTYHATQTDARNDVSPLSSPYTSASATIYARVENNTTGCYKTVAVTLTVNPKPVIADAATTICNGATVNLTNLITSYATYSNPVWTMTTVGGTAVSTPTAVTPSVTTTYVLVAENGSGCKDTANVVVTVNPKPVIADAATTICSGTSVDLTSLITSYATYSNPVWTMTTVGGTAVATPTAVTPSVTTTYVLVAENASGCKDTADVVVTVNPKPVIADAATTICSGTSVDLTSLITSYATYSNPVWTMTTVGGTAVSTPTAVTPSVTTTYVLVAENGSGCKDTANVVVTVNPLPDFTLSKPVACPGTSEEVNITGLTNANTATAELKLDVGAYAAYPSPAIVMGLSVGSHTFTIKNENGCETAKSITISPVAAPVCLPVTVTRSIGSN